MTLLFSNAAGHSLAFGTHEVVLLTPGPPCVNTGYVLTDTSTPLSW